MTTHPLDVARYFDEPRSWACWTIGEVILLDKLEGYIHINSTKSGRKYFITMGGLYGTSWVLRGIYGINSNMEGIYSTSAFI